MTNAKRRHFMMGAMSALTGMCLTPSRSVAAAHYVRMGVLGSAQEDVWKTVAENAHSRGFLLQIVPFRNGNEADDALADHKIDINAFQNRFFLDDQNSMKGYDLVSVGRVWLAPLGVYSKELKSIDLLPSKPLHIAIADDPTGEARALLLLQKLGFIKLASISGARPTLIDIERRIRPCTIEKMPMEALPSALAKDDLVLMPTDYVEAKALRDGDIPVELLTQEAVQGNPHMTLLVVNADDVGAFWLGPILWALQMPNVEQEITHVFGGNVYPAWKF